MCLKIQFFLVIVIIYLFKGPVLQGALSCRVVAKGKKAEDLFKNI